MPARYSWVAISPVELLSSVGCSSSACCVWLQPHLLPRPADWGEWLQVSGHWFLDDQKDWQPSDELLRFLEAGKPPVYIGFGSMVDEQIEHATHIVLRALQANGQRGILLGGWGGLGKGELPPTILRIDAVPHHWLFPQLAAVVHHGGAGTTATGLRCGRPTVVVPFFADQPFWGMHVHELGCGPHPISFARLNVSNLADAIDKAVNDPAYSHNAKSMAVKLQNEQGVDKAIAMSTTFLETNQPSRREFS
jgi:sterol 3beta-glucosyltransferase